MTMQRTLSLLAAAVLLLFGPISVVPLAQEPAAPPTFDATALEALDATFVTDIERAMHVGCVALVAHRNEVIYHKAFGHRDRAKDLPMTEDTIFRIYSMTKPVTSVAVMMLVEEGKVGLDDPVGKYLPALAELRVAPSRAARRVDENAEPTAAERPITIRDLLRHTSGLTYGFFGNTPTDQAYRAAGILTTQSNLQELIDALAEIPLLYQPGTRFHYSVSVDVLGRVVEVVSEQSLDEFFAERIFAPLGMRDTFFTVPQNKRERLAEMYTPAAGGKLVPADPMESWRFVNANDFHSGGGGLCSTAHDYLRFCQMLLHEGELNGKRLLKPETVREMTHNQLADLPRAPRSFRFGLGFAIDREGRYAWGGAAGTRFWIDPKNDVIGLFLVQIMPDGNVDQDDRMKEAVGRALRGE